MDERRLVLGLGNILLQDEGLGVHAIDRLRFDPHLPAGVELLDGGTLGLGLLPYLTGVSSLLILDAIEAGKQPGALVRLEGEEIPAALMPGISMHDVGLQELLAVGRLANALPERMVLLGLQPASLDWGTDLTPIVEASLECLIRAVLAELEVMEKALIASDRSFWLKAEA